MDLHHGYTMYAELAHPDLRSRPRHKGAGFKKAKNIPYPAGIQRSRIGVFLTSEEVRGDNDMEDEPLFIASLQGEGRSQM